MGISAKVICHSQAPNGEQLITMEVEFHRFILAEINTHRTLSRNYQSSRAVPVPKMIDQVRIDPAIPVHWGKNQRGMVAEGELDSTIGYTQWLVASSYAADQAEKLHVSGYHKQIVNRIIEPYIWTKGVITGTLSAWEGLFKLRCHKDAQPEFQALAYKIKEAIENSVPNMLNHGDYHLPYLPDDVDYSIEDAVKISCSCCGQVSYRVLDDSLEKAIKVYNMLNLPEKGVEKEDPPHFSPAEHVAKIVKESNINRLASGNFNSQTFWQYRKALEFGTEGKFIK